MDDLGGKNLLFLERWPIEKFFVEAIVPVPPAEASVAEEGRCLVE